MEITEKDYKEERFEFTIYVNDNIICKRNFKIFNYIEESMNTLEFKEKMDEVVKLIDDDLKSKSRVYTWFYYNPQFPDANEEFTSKLIEPWACTFKIVVSDNKKDVFTKIWDGYAYPRAIREKVDLGNKSVKVVSMDGQSFIYDKESFFETNKDRLSFEQEVLKAMIMDKSDVLLQITKKICEVCSFSRDEIKEIGFFDYKDTSKYLSKYTTVVNYPTTEIVKNDDGSIKSTRHGKGKKYPYSLQLTNKKVIDAWGRAVANKTKEYFKNLH